MCSADSPRQTPLEIDGEILRFAALQLGADAETIHAYARRRQTVSAHQRRVGQYLRLRTFDTAAGERLARFLRISVKWNTHSGDVEHGFRRSGTLVGAQRR